MERPAANDIAATLERIRSPSFDLRIKSVGQFEKRSGGALWAGIDPKEPVAALAAKVERAVQEAGMEPERRAFSPHITLARWNRRNAEAVETFLRRHADLRSEPFVVDEFTLRLSGVRRIFRCDIHA